MYHITTNQHNLFPTIISSHIFPLPLPFTLGDYDDDHRTNGGYTHHHHAHGGGGGGGGFSVGPLSVLGERNEAMMGLQRQKAMSTKQNEQLQREVEALQKQLAQLEELEGEMEQSSRQTGQFLSFPFTLLLSSHSISMAIVDIPSLRCCSCYALFCVCM